MNKQEFLCALEKELCSFSEEDIKGYKEYYSEMIDDRMEEGLSEEEAVADMGSPEEIASRIISESSFPKLLKSKFKPKHKLKAWEIVLIALGSPIWFSLLVAAFAVVISLVASAFAVIISLYAAAIAVGASTLGGIAGFITNNLLGNHHLGFALLGCGILCAGMSILMFIGMNRLTKLLLSLGKRLITVLKTRLVRKEETI